MAFSSPSSSSSPPSTHKWDVFLSFRGIDTRNTFVAHLYPALCRRGIKTYRDDENLERGEKISPKLLEAIEESMISIVILSPNYASSSWCLEELTKILECNKTKQQTVLPVFYHVDPSDVRHHRGSFGEALAKHQKRFKEDPKVQRWKEALQEVADLAGQHLNKDRNEYDFMLGIIQWVDSKIGKSTDQLDVAEHPIGLESHLKDLSTNLRIGMNDITLMIGICGIGGIGKTTIAKEIFNSFGNQFEARCFLANVREISSRGDGLVKLQEKLLLELLGKFGSSNNGSVGGTNVIKHRLRFKRVLLILDDVNELGQLKELAGDKDWFGPGSRIVITTRDQHLLTYDQVDSMYKVQGLDDNQAVQLFSWHAFKRDKPDECFVAHTKRIIGYAKGLPLALTVLGSDLHGRRIEYWVSALKRYEKGKSALEESEKKPHKDIFDILKISYDELDDNEKKIFLDIACFFHMNPIEYVMKILESYRPSSFTGIERLKDKCLININSYQYVEMHDLLQEMGTEIVRQESPVVGKRSRLWFHEDVRQVLEDKTGTNKIEAILLDFPEGHDKIRLHSEAFMKMRNLRLFINWNAKFSTGPNYLSNRLRLLDWPEYPSSCLPSDFREDNLVKFNMRDSLIKELGGLKFKNLTDMDLCGCEFLTKVSDLSSSPNLEKLDLDHCENLVEVDDSVGSLNKLSRFSVRGCCKLRILPKRFKMRSLCCFDLKYCLSLEDFPEIEYEMKFLHSLNIGGTSIKELPSSIENLNGLQTLYLDHYSMEELPSSIGNLAWLRQLYGAGYIDQMRSIDLRIVKVDDYSQPRNIGKVEEEDGIQSTPFVVSTAQGVRFARLKDLYLNNCKKLKEILSLPSSIESVEAHECTSLESFALPSEILVKNNGRNFLKLRRIELYGCHKLLATMTLNPSWEERHCKEYGLYPPFEQPGDISIIFPGKRIPNWFSYCKDAHDNNMCEIDIYRPHYWSNRNEFVFYVVFGFRVGIINQRMEDDIFVRIHDGSGWKDLYTQNIRFFPTDSDHVWMYWPIMSDWPIMSYHEKMEVSRFRFECRLELVVFRSVGIHLLKKDEEN
ncbi:hypothetical protein I3842_16G110800 [Carya illinoinensis]|uniref:TIR domain-containing protein n=1 Tax=Carya illinoinensis TaxID=32201 RepID=A0A922A7E8_CARIL|nr:hypothetical protein I3842_16G110800 [Carya illinoinensis]